MGVIYGVIVRSSAVIYDDGDRPEVARRFSTGVRQPLLVCFVLRS